FCFELRVEFELGPESIDQSQGVAIDPLDERPTGRDQLRHARVAEAPRHLLAHPVPQPFDRVEVRAVTRQVHHLDPQSGRFRRDHLGYVTGGVVPDQHQAPPLAAAPPDQLSEELHRPLAVAPAVLPQQALAVREVVSPVGVHPLGQPRAIADPPQPLAPAPPDITRVEVAVDVDLIGIDQDDLAVARAGEQLEQLLDVGGPLLRSGLAQELLPFLPREVRPAQDPADGPAAGEPAEDLGDPLLELLQGPAMAGPAVVDRATGLDEVNDLLRPARIKKGARPPVRRAGLAAGASSLYRWPQPRTVSSWRPMWAAQVVALNRPEAIRYKAWNRSRLRRCGVSSEARRKSSSSWPHLDISTRIMGRTPGWLCSGSGCSLPPSYRNTPHENSGSQPDRGLEAGARPPGKEPRHTRPRARGS